MKMDEVAGSGNDEFYTPKYAVSPIMEFIPENAKVWCPFDSSQSLIVKEISKKANVINSHIENGENFFDMQIDADFIISNPPYSLKYEVFNRLFSMGRPFAMLVGVVGLFESQKRFEMFSKNQFEIMYLNRRVSYFKSYNDQKPSLNPPFSSVWLCSKMLPEKIMFREIVKS